MTRTEFIAEARTWTNTKWQLQHRTMDGADCVGWLIALASKHNLVKVEEPADYRYADPIYLLKMCDKYLLRKPKENLRVGDIAMFRVGLHPRHLGLIADYHIDGHLSMIHASQDFGKVVEHRLTPQWRQRIAFVFDIPNLVD